MCCFLYFNKHFIKAFVCNFQNHFLSHKVHFYANDTIHFCNSIFNFWCQFAQSKSVNLIVFFIFYFSFKFYILTIKQSFNCYGVSIFNSSFFVNKWQGFKLFGIWLCLKGLFIMNQNGIYWYYLIVFLLLYKKWKGGIILWRIK